MLTLLQAIEVRRSVRTFTHTPPPAALLRECGADAGQYVRLPAEGSLDGVRIGTYGVISGTPAYAAIVYDPADLTSAMQAGMAGERFLLECVRRGLGTIWLGATYDRRAVERAVGHGPGAKVGAVIAVGHPAGRLRLVERIMRGAVRSASRLPVDGLVVAGTPGAAVRRGIEAARLAPSAHNRQPWRFGVAADGSVDVYARSAEGFDPLDCGIGLSHFLLASPAWRLAAPRGTHPTLTPIATLLPIRIRSNDTRI